jgi:hypothetical protein
VAGNFKFFRRNFGGGGKARFNVAAVSSSASAGWRRIGGSCGEKANRRSADRLLHGLDSQRQKPADLRVVQATKFEFAINRQTARAAWKFRQEWPRDLDRRSFAPRSSLTVAERLGIEASAFPRYIEGSSCLIERWRINRRKLVHCTAEEIFARRTTGHVLSRSQALMRIQREQAEGAAAKARAVHQGNREPSQLGVAAAMVGRHDRTAEVRHAAQVPAISALAFST